MTERDLGGLCELDVLDYINDALSKWKETFINSDKQWKKA